MSVIVEATLSVILDRLVDELLSITPTLHKHKADIAKEVKKWGPILEDLRCVVEDAENNKSGKSEIAHWLQDLEDIASDVEDVLQEFEYDTKQSQKRAKVSKFFSSVLKSLTTPKAVIELQKLTERLNEIVERKQRVELLLKGNAIIPWQRTIRDPSGPISAERKLYGREAEKNKIMNFLRNQKDEMDVLPIVGAGGIGKTTLLQHIYNDEEVVNSFQVRAWVCVSQEWNLCNIFKSIIEDITGQPCHLQNLDRKVRDEVKNKKFCIVLDDLWSLTITQWNQLRAPLLRAGVPGSKILVTTRNSKVADCVKTVDTYIDLSCLSKDDWLELYCSYVGFDVRKSSNYKLREVGEDISKRCGGLPLAATILGSHLHGNHNENDWSAMLNNKSLMSRDGQYQIELVLKMSYDDLPYILKSCFLYCTIFPEDYHFREYDLVQLWIAAGFIKSSDDGHGYFVELVSQSLLTSFQDYYVMHDLIRDMGRNISNNRYCRWETTLESSWKKLKHLSIHKSMMGQVIADLRRERQEITFPLRTLMLIGGEYDIMQIHDGNLLFSKLPKLRVLQGRALPIQNVSKFICQMKHLKYLDLCGCTGLTQLPIEIGNLCNLVGLDLQHCVGLTWLPIEVGKLYNLEWLDLEGCIGLMSLPREIENLHCLTRLYLQGCTGLTWLPTEVGKLSNLTDLDLKGCTGLTTLPVEMGNMGNLQWLDLQGCIGLTMLPKEIGNLGKLQWLDLQECTGLTVLPGEVGNLDNLQELYFLGCTRLTTLPMEVGNLSSLQWLYLQGCTRLTVLPMEVGNLGGLQGLNLEGCTGLTMLPREVGNLGSLQELSLQRCRGLTILPIEVGNLSSLQWLYLQGCTELTILPVEVGNLCNLQWLDLKECIGLIMLPTEVGNLGSLQRLDLQGCTGLTILPVEIGNLGSLQQLDLQGCTELIMLPLEIGNLCSLQELNLQGCTRLTTLPMEVGNLDNLQDLNLKGCIGLTTLPVELGNLGNLQWLDLQGCIGLTTLPIELGNLGSLQQLDLQGCTRLTTLPIEVGKLGGL